MSARHSIQLLSIGALFVTLIGCGGSTSATSAKKYAFVGNRSGDSISRYSVEASGALTSLGAETTTMNTPGGLVTSPDGKFLYMSNFEGGIEQFSIGANGSLNHLSTPWVSLPDGNYGIAITPDGKYVYATSEDGHVYQYTVGNDGGLTPYSVASGPAGDYPVHVSVTADGKFAYVTFFNDNSIRCYTIGNDGKLTGNGADVTANLSGPWSMDFSSNGQYLYVANSISDTIAEFAINVDGTLTPLAPATAPSLSECYGVAVSKTGNKLFAAGYQETGLKRFDLNAGTGALTELNPNYDSGPVAQWPIAVSPQNHVYVCNQNSATVSTYNISGDGTLTLVATTPSGLEPASIAFTK